MSFLRSSAAIATFGILAHTLVTRTRITRSAVAKNSSAVQPVAGALVPAAIVVPWQFGIEITRADIPTCLARLDCAGWEDVPLMPDRSMRQIHDKRA